MQGRNPTTDRQKKKETYALALRCVELRRREFLDDAEIARREGISEKYAGNFIRAVENLPPQIKDDWSRGDPRATTMFLFKLSSTKLNDDGRLRLWMEKTPLGR